MGMQVLGQLVCHGKVSSLVQIVESGIAGCGDQGSQVGIGDKLE